jgi:hypothetical protein
LIIWKARVGEIPGASPLGFASGCFAKLEVVRTAQVPGRNLESMSLLFVVSIFAIFSSLGLIGYIWFRPRMLAWGATPDEVNSAIVGDEMIPRPVLRSTRSMSIRTSPARVWPWLAQMGQGRGGFYSYEFLENLLGMDIHNADQIKADLISIKPGDSIPFWRGAGIKVWQVDPPSQLVLAGTLNQPLDKEGEDPTVGGTWVFILREIAQNETRLIVRSRVAEFKPRWFCSLLMIVLEPLHFIMEQRMLIGIKARAERIPSQWHG